jgi:hypothetical protein
MLRRTRLRLGFQPTDPDAHALNYLGTFGWHYSFNQVMHTPRTINRTMSAVNVTNRTPTRYPSVFIPLEGMHPTFRVALEPYLRKLVMSTTLPSTKPADAVADYERIAPNVLDRASRMAWLAKVIQLCAIHRQHDLSARLWKAEQCDERYVKGDEVPPAPLIQAYLFSCCKGKAPETKEIFQCSQKQKWNLSPSFETRLWDHLTKFSGRTNDENFFIEIWKEAIDVNANFDAIDPRAWMLGMNTIKSPENYAYLKQNLFKISASRIDKIAKAFVRLRSNPNGDDNFKPGVELAENDSVYYHVLWHARIRSPLTFHPRQLYFDYKPSILTTDSKTQKAEDIVKERIAKWKDEGLLPQDYEANVEFTDREAYFKQWTKTERWKQKQTWFEEGRFKLGKSYVSTC